MYRYNQYTAVKLALTNQEASLTGTATVIWALYIAADTLIIKYTIYVLIM